MTQLHITFHSRAEIKRMVDDEFIDKDTVVISVNDTEAERDDMGYFLTGRANRVILQLFLDNESSFQKSQAETLVKLIDEAYEDGLRRFVIHCWAGISRSGAIAKYINDFYGEGVDHPLLGDYKVYNKRVYTMLENAFQKQKYGLTHSWET